MSIKEQGQKKSILEGAVSEKMIAAEANVSIVRSIVIVFGTMTFLLLDKSGMQVTLAYSLLPFIWIYGAILLFYKPYRKYPILTASWFSAITDSVFATLWIYATGGFESPYYLMFFTSIIAMGFRFALNITLITAAIYSASYALLLIVIGDMAGNEALVLTRCGFIVIIGYFSYLITEETLRQTQRRLEMQRVAELAHTSEENLRQVNLLLEEKVKERTAELEASVNRFRILLESLPQMAWTADAGGKIGYYNEKWTEFIGMPLTAEDWEKYIHPDDLQPTWEKWQHSVTTGEHFEIENRWLRQDGKYRWMLTRANAIRNSLGRIELWVGTATDIHEQKVAEQKLEERIEERTKALTESNKNLLRSNEELEQFAYVASHDLKEPLRMIASYSELLVRKMNAEDPEAVEYSGYIKNGVKRMQALINDLLDYSRIGKSQVKYTWVDFNNLVNDVLSVLQVVVSESGATVEVKTELPRVRCSEQQIKQLLQNLIENAVKFRRPDVPPHVEVNVDRQGYDWVFSVKDNGIGISEAYRERVFVIFQRLHAANRYPGTGIGLAISKKIVEFHGGRIWFESEPGQGTTFFFTLPA